MRVLVDTSIWVDYFKSGANSGKLDGLLESNNVATNDVILAELVPFLTVKKQFGIIGLLNEVPRLTLAINWPEIIQWQVNCLTAGFNGIGIPDLVIAQNARQHNCGIYSLDKHFRLLNQSNIDICLVA